MVQLNLNYPQNLFSYITIGMFISLKWLNFILLFTNVNYLLH